MGTLMSGKCHLHDPLSLLPLALNKQWPPSKLTLFALKPILLCRVTFPALKWRVTLVCVCPTLQSGCAYSVSHGAATLRDLFFLFKLMIAYFRPWISSKWTHLSCLVNVCSWGRFIVSLESRVLAWHDSAIYTSEAWGADPMVRGNRHSVNTGDVSSFIFGRGAKEILRKCHCINNITKRPQPTPVISPVDITYPDIKQWEKHFCDTLLQNQQPWSNH